MYNVLVPLMIIIEEANPSDFPDILRLAKELNLDYPGQGKDRFWVARTGNRIVGIVGLKEHSDFLELCAFGVDKDFRLAGIGRRLIKTLLNECHGDIYLATTIPDFFIKVGFSPADKIPDVFTMRWASEWCHGCQREKCVIMVRTKKKN